MKTIEKIRFSRAGKRRFNKRVKLLTNLLAIHKELFLFEWDKLTKGWISEIDRRSKNLREGNKFHNSDNNDAAVCPGEKQIFEILQIVDALLEACGDEAIKLVGAETRQLLIKECFRAASTAAISKPVSRQSIKSTASKDKILTNLN